MVMSLTKLVDHLREEGPYDQPPSLLTSQKDTPPLGDETFEGEAPKEERNPIR